MEKKPSNKWLRLSGAAFQMGAIIALLTYLGDRVDTFYQFNFPIGTLVGSITGVGIAMYIIIKEAINLNS